MPLFLFSPNIPPFHPQQNPGMIAEIFTAEQVCQLGLLFQVIYLERKEYIFYNDGLKSVFYKPLNFIS